MKQTVTVLVGNVGSGKTTFYEKEFDPAIDVRISQDVLGSREACIQAAEKALQDGKSIVIDRVNFNRRQRQPWMDLANKYKAEAHAIFLYVPKEVCAERVQARKGHETITDNMDGRKKFEIVLQFDNIMEEPKIREGYKSVISVRNYD